MANYILDGKRYSGHSVNDTIPSAVNKHRYTRYDTDTKDEWWSNGTTWLRNLSIKDADIPSNAEIDVLKINQLNDIWRKRGSLSFVNYLTPVGSGLFDSAVFYYDSYVSQQSNAKGYGSLLTGAIINQPVGFATHHTNGITRRSWNPLLLIKLSLPDMIAQDSRLYLGYVSRTTSLIPASSNPLGTALSGALLGYRNTDTQFQFISNDGLGANELFTPTGVNVPSGGSGNFTFVIKYNPTDSKFYWYIYDTGNVLLQSGSSSTQVPSSTTNLNVQCLYYNNAGTSTSLKITNADIRQGA